MMQISSCIGRHARLATGPVAISSPSCSPKPISLPAEITRSAKVVRVKVRLRLKLQGLPSHTLREVKLEKLWDLLVSLKKRSGQDVSKVISRSVKNEVATPR